MADTFTAKLGLRQYDPSLFYDVSKFSADNLLVDNAFGTIICTSTTRPSTGLFNGMQLWETDTERFVVRVAGAWVVAPIMRVMANQAARDAIVTPYQGMAIYRLDRAWEEKYDGVGWRVQGVAICASAADRDAVITRLYDGQLALTTDTGTIWQRKGGAWVPLYGSGGSYFDSTQNTSGTTSAGAFTEVLTGGTACSGTFVAPSSGKVDIYNSAQVGNNTGGQSSIMSHEVRTGAVIGSGTVVQAAAIENGILSGASVRCTVITSVTGLTSGATYNVLQKYVNTGGTGTFANKRLSVRPAA